MKTILQRKFPRWGQLALCLVIAVGLAACGGDDPTPETPPAATEVPTADTSASSESDSQAESPLDQPESPISQPESPLTTAMSAPKTEAEAIALANMTTAEEPTAGMGSIAGVVYSFGTLPGAIRGTQVYLEKADEFEGEYFPPAISHGPKVANGDIIVETNNFGQLYMEVLPGHYYASVWTLYGWNLVVGAVNEEAPRLITIEEGDQLDLGVLYVFWP